MSSLPAVFLHVHVAVSFSLQENPVSPPCPPTNSSHDVSVTREQEKSPVTVEGFATVDSSSYPAQGPWKLSISSGLSFLARFRVSLVFSMSMMVTSVQRNEQKLSFRLAQPIVNMRRNSV